MFTRSIFSPLSIFFPVLILLFILDIVLKAMALWRSAKSGQKGWFIALMIINSLGILPAIYLLFFQNKTKS